MILIHSQVQPPLNGDMSGINVGWLIAPFRLCHLPRSHPEPDQQIQTSGSRKLARHSLSIHWLGYSWMTSTCQQNKRARTRLHSGDQSASHRPGAWPRAGACSSWSPQAGLLMLSISRQKSCGGAVHWGLRVGAAECRGLKGIHWRASCWFFGSEGWTFWGKKSIKYRSMEISVSCYESHKSLELTERRS